jgi:DNA-binding transcriptional LysR family regulator
MDFKYLEYIVMIEKEKNISRAAKKLFVTQSALNQHLLKLEQSLDTPLFYRTGKDCIPTEAGKIYLETAQAMLQMKEEAYKRISDIAQTNKGRLSIAFTSGRATNMFSYVYPIFHEQYPDIDIRPMELGVKKQRPLIASGELDIGFQNINESQHSHAEYISLGMEELLFVRPKRIVSDKKESLDLDALPTVSLQDLKDETFILMHKESTLRDLVDGLFDEAQVTPNILFESSNMNIIVNMIKMGSCSSIVPSRYLTGDISGLDCCYLEGRPTWELVASYRKGAYLSKPAKAFIQLVRDFWEENNE